MKIPADITPRQEPRLDLIVIVEALAGRVRGVKTSARDDMGDDGFAASPLAVGRKSTIERRGAVDPVKLYRLIEKRKITIKQFLDCVKVNVGPLEDFLPGAQIDAISDPPSAASTLTVELRPEAAIDFDALESAMVDAVRRGQPAIIPHLPAMRKHQAAAKRRAA